MPRPRLGRGTRVPVLTWVLAALVDIGLAACRRGAEAPSAAAEGTPSPRAPHSGSVSVQSIDADPPVRTKRPAGRRAPILWLGLDGLDWELLDRLVAEGRMPNWKRLTGEGWTARLTSFSPPLSPIVWTTIATGVGPEVHRVLDFQEVDPVSGERVPISGRSRAVPAIWNLASSAGESVGVVGWWATHPAEEVAGFFVSDRASPILFEGLPRAGVAYPAALSQGLEQVLARDGVVSDEEVASFVDVPAAEIHRIRADGAGLEDPVVALSRILASTRVQQRVGRDLYDRNLPDLLMLYFEGTDAIGHVFAPYVAPRLACVSEADFARYRHAADDYYALIDGLIGQWMRRADEDGATLIVNSDHGFRWGADRPCETAGLRAGGAAYWHRLEGVLTAYGARVRRGSGVGVGEKASRGSASVFDLAPTVCALSALPIDRRMGGRVLREAFPDAKTPERRDLFDTIAVRRVAAEAATATEANEYAARLRALGYLSGGEATRLAPPGGDRPGPTEKGWHNLGLYLRDTRKDLRAAEAAFQKALEMQPNSAADKVALAGVYRDRGDDRLAIDWLFQSLAAGHADPEGTVLRWYVAYDEEGKHARAREVLERGSRAYPSSEAIAREIGLLHYRARDCRGAWDSVARFAPASRTPETLNVLALFQGCLGRKDEAIGLFERSLAIKPDQPAVTRSIEGLRRQ
ncbi:MAG TPA: alkaline phosphatase family protein [Thermoanaerobaculia bacterium]